MLHGKGLLKTLVGILILILIFLLILVWTTRGDFGTIGTIFALMLLVSAAMLVVPAIAYIASHNHLGRKKGLIICIINSVALFALAAIFPIVTIVKNEPCDALNTICEVQFSWEILKMASILAVLYCLANICFWVDFNER